MTAMAPANAGIPHERKFTAGRKALLHVNSGPVKHDAFSAKSKSRHHTENKSRSCQSKTRLSKCATLVGSDIKISRWNLLAKLGHPSAIAEVCRLRFKASIRKRREHVYSPVARCLSSRRRPPLQRGNDLSAQKSTNSGFIEYLFQKTLASQDIPARNGTNEWHINCFKKTATSGVRPWR